MKLSFMFIYLTSIVSAKRHNKLNTSDEFFDESHMHVPFVEGFLDLRGGVRRELTLVAALEDEFKNMICSPWSVLMQLGKLALGAEDIAEQELLSAIGLTSSKQIHTTFVQLITNMEYLPGVNLDVASKIYVNTEKSINEMFMTRTKLIFRSSCQKFRPWNPRQTAQNINDWVAEQTNNKIRQLISASDIMRNTSLVLVNALYFSGNWKYRFDKTFTAQFYSPSGSRLRPMMSRQGVFNYWKCDILEVEVIEIPYEGLQSSMIIVLPFTAYGLWNLLRNLKYNAQPLNQALDKMKPTDVILSMPKFKIESQHNLNSLYRKIGVYTIFDTKHSHLSKIINGEKVFVSKAIHKAVIEINEKGSEAAPAPEALGNKLFYITPQKVEANRPFLFYIKAYEEQLLGGLFCGTDNY